ncbi:hypothetical protein PRUB_a2931 [Pseudoalteromonas rubra]|uniref:O-antigen ligase domain-containing protein n=2 Tax=Pseudoalteromonas rubra TaxID=43658 RepID=A0A8T0CBZ7_9GAMM|nr:hypothetical protein PRUB_a2931 [Pseudoalteromonas rubra]
MIFSLFFALLTSSFWQGYSDPDASYAMKLISIVMFVFLTVYFANKTDTSGDFLLKLSVCYGLAFCLFKWVGIIKASSAGALSYLNLALPIGMAVIGAYLMLLRSNGGLKKAVILLALLFLLVSMLTTPARGVLLGTFLILVFMSFRYQRKRHIAYLALCFTPVLVLYWEQIQSVSTFFLSKMERLIFSIEEEARYKYYVGVFELVSEQLYGFGLRSYSVLLGFYPHSLSLEMLIVGGFVLAGVFWFIIFLSFTKIYKLLGLKPDLDYIYLLTVYFLIQWHLSYELSSAYGVFICLSFILSKSVKLPSKTEAYPGGKLCV